MKSKLEFAEIGFFQCDSNGKISTLNTAAYEYFGLKKKYSEIHEVIGENLTDIYKEYEDVFQKINTEGSLYNHALHIELLDGKKRYLLNNCIVIDDNTYEIIVFDITVQKELEQQLLYSEKKLHSIIDMIPDIVYRVDPDGIIIFISDSIKKYGYEPEELLGTEFIDLVHPDDKEKAVFHINDRRTGTRKTRFFEVRLVTKARDTVSFEIEDSLVKENVFSVFAEGLYSVDEDSPVFLGTQGIARDISFRKKSELVIQRSEEHWKTIIESLDDGYYEVDLRGKIRYVNSSMSSMIQYPRDEIIGRDYNVLIIDENGTLRSIFAEVFKTGEPAKLTNLKVKRKDGKIRELEGSASLMRDMLHQPAGFIGMIRDITDQKRFEQELLRARKLEAIGIFSGGIAHDYNNALTAIIGNLTLAKMEIEPEENESLLEIIEDAEKASLRMKDLTQQLSSFSKGGRPIKQKISLKAILESVIEEKVNRFKGTFILHIDDALWPIEADQFQIKHVLESIIQNAIEAMDNQGTVEIVVSNKEVREEASHHEITLVPGEYILISVKDEGPGIPEEAHYNIFDPYYTTKKMSSGMGLALSYAIIKRHHGYIDFVSSEGEGAEFLVYLPLSRE